MHRILMPDGSAFVFIENKNNAEPTYGGMIGASTEQRSPISSASNDIIDDKDTKVNPSGENNSKNVRYSPEGAGYDGYSMSNNARAAYEAGEKPISKWTKANILAEVRELDESKVDMLSKVPVSVLKDKLLYRYRCFCFFRSFGDVPHMMRKSRPCR